MKNIYWFDLDHTLWETDSKYWIIDKNNPSKYIIRIENYEANLILNGYYKSFEHKIYYNGLDGWLSEDIWNKIQKTKSTTLEDIGISLREFEDDELIIKNSKNILIHINRIEHLQNTKHTVNILTARGNKDGHITLLNKLKNELLKINININDEYFVNDPNQIKIHATSAEKKMICILEHIIGYKIKNFQFIPIVLDKYDNSYFYDDEELNIETCKNINKYLKEYLNKTQSWLKDKIIQQVNIRKPKLYLNTINSNELNPFNTDIVEINI